MKILPTTLIASLAIGFLSIKHFSKCSMGVARGNKNTLVLMIFCCTNRSNNNEAIDIELHRGNDGLGISIAGGYGSPHGNIPIFVKTVSKVGAAADEGRLKKGDQIISVNGESLKLSSLVYVA